MEPISRVVSLMLRVPLHKIEAGMILARPIPVPNQPNRYLLQRDREIPLDLVPRLAQLGILEVWVRNRDLEFLEDVIDEELGERQRHVYQNVRRCFEAMLQGAWGGLDARQFQDSIRELFEFLKKSPGSNILLQKLDAFDNYLISHSTNVCYLAMLVGMRLERYLIDERHHKPAREAKNLQLLGLGCLLHDIGKMNVPRSILDKPGRLTRLQTEQMRRHTVYGYQLVYDSVPAAAAQVALNHHQRYNGEGYPGRIDPRTGDTVSPLSGRDIPIFSRIATLADIYDAATSHRCYSPGKPPVQVLHEMRHWCQGFFDPVVEEAFYRVVPPFPIGQIVVLSSGIEAVVVEFNPEFPCRPKVQCLRDPYGRPFRDPALEEIDLSLTSDQWIASVDGFDVTPFLDLPEGFAGQPQCVTSS